MKIAIIGAGIAGLTTAKMLREVAEVTVYEKSRGAGGRACTRYTDLFDFDHGAQFFTVKAPQFKELLNPLIQSDIVKSWNAKFVEIKKNKVINQRQWNDDFPHYVGAPSMSEIGRFLAQDLDVKLNTEVQIRKKEDQWHIIDTDDVNHGSFDWVISTAPSLQSAALLSDEFKFHNILIERNMIECFSLMLGFENKLDLAWEAALISDADISWISVNSSKPDRKKDFTLLIHSTNLWAKNNFNTKKDTVIEQLLDATSGVTGKAIYNAKHIDVHRWKFANIKKQIIKPPFIDQSNRIAACGDWCIKGRIESAFLSGFELANEMRNLFK